MIFYVSTAIYFLLHCDEWDHFVAPLRHKFVTGATLLQLLHKNKGWKIVCMIRILGSTELGDHNTGVRVRVIVVAKFSWSEYSIKSTTMYESNMLKLILEWKIIKPAGSLKHYDHNNCMQTDDERQVMAI